ncbi:hypothetical protein Droror1_Dr00023166 [Drosera rotundifolia]
MSFWHTTFAGVLMMFECDPVNIRSGGLPDLTVISVLPNSNSVGNYCNFGVFELYGDSALADALDIALKMILSIPLADVLAFRKICDSSPGLALQFFVLTRAYFAFVDVLFKSHMTFILNSDSSAFMHFVGSLESGLRDLDTTISSQCSSAVDELATYYFNNITMREAPPSQAAVNLAQRIAECPTLFLEILKTLFQIVLFEDYGSQWSLSRPMLSLILLSEQVRHAFLVLPSPILLRKANQHSERHMNTSSTYPRSAKSHIY